MVSRIVTARAELAGTLITDYFYREVQEPRELVVLLHGFQQTGQIVFEKLLGACPEAAAVLAPNATFPMPERKEDGSYRAGFSWYFYNPAMDDYFIDMRVALEALEGLVRKLGLEALPKRLVGFSQGGYLAPLAAVRLAHVRQVVGIGAEYLPDELRPACESAGIAWPPRFRADAIHGLQDEVVRPADARKAHDVLKAAGMRGEWVGLEGVGHRMPAEVSGQLKRLLTLD